MFMQQTMRLCCCLISGKHPSMSDNNSDACLENHFMLINIKIKCQTIFLKLWFEQSLPADPFACIWCFLNVNFVSCVPSSTWRGRKPPLCPDEFWWWARNQAWAASVSPAHSSWVLHTQNHCCRHHNLKHKQQRGEGPWGMMSVSVTMLSVVWSLT